MRRAKILLSGTIAIYSSFKKKLKKG